MITTYARKLLGNVVIAANLRGQARVPFLPRSRVEGLRDARIRRIVSYAARYVPYYRDLFEREGIDARGVRGAADLDRLPLLDREVVRQRPDLFLAQASPAKHALSFLTSGTTGIPLEIWHDRRSLIANIAFGERERAPMIHCCGGGFRPKELYIGYETSTFKKVMAFYEESTLLPVRPRRRFVSLLEPLERVAAIANEERPDIIVGYGGWIDLFFNVLAAKKIDICLPKMVMTMGEAMPPGRSEQIESHFGVPVLSRYNAVEAFKIAFFCEQRTGFHVHEDLCHVRIVNPDGSPAAAGRSGQIVISNLVNRASVLLNYPIGDVASMSDRACPCGRSFRLMSNLEGRVEDILTLVDGRNIHPRSVWQIFKNDRDVLQYQLIQHAADRFELRLVTVDDPIFRRVLDRTLPRLRDLLGADAVIETVHRTETSRRPDGKYRSVISSCKTVSAGRR